MKRRWLKLKHSAEYCDMDVATFDILIRPYIDESPVGSRLVLFDTNQIDDVLIGKRKKTAAKPVMNGFLLECRNSS